MPLYMIDSGNEVTLKGITRGDRLKKKLQDMGLTIGVKFSVVSNHRNGPMIVDVRGTRLALGRGIVSKILVEKV